MAGFEVANGLLDVHLDLQGLKAFPIILDLDETVVSATTGPQLKLAIQKQRFEV